MPKKKKPESQTAETEQKNPGGRPTDYRLEYDEQAYKLALLGLNNEEIATFFEVTDRTIYNWIDSIPSFKKWLNKGRIEADTDVARALYHRAVGYNHPAVKIMQYDGVPITVDYTEHYPPDTGAATLWLKNRQPEKWRDKVDVNHGSQKDNPLKVFLQQIMGTSIQPVQNAKKSEDSEE